MVPHVLEQGEADVLVLLLDNLAERQQKLLRVMRDKDRKCGVPVDRERLR